MVSEIVICTTCERQVELIASKDPASWLTEAPAAGPASPSRGEALARAVEALIVGSAHVRMRRVDCLGRCLSPGNVDLVGRGKVRVELTALRAADAPALVAAAEAHAMEADLTLAHLSPDMAARALIRLPARRRT